MQDSRDRGSQPWCSIAISHGSIIARTKLGVQQVSQLHTSRTWLLCVAPRMSSPSTCMISTARVVMAADVAAQALLWVRNIPLSSTCPNEQSRNSGISRQSDIL